MPEQPRPLSKETAPNPASSYDRSDPNRESGMGRMDAPKTAPDKHPDKLEETVGNKQQTDRQLNSEDVVNQRAKEKRKE